MAIKLCTVIRLPLACHEAERDDYSNARSPGNREDCSNTLDLTVMDL